MTSDCCRENLCLITDTSILGSRIARELDALIRVYGKPACIVSDHGQGFTSRAILKWAEQNDVAWHYINPGKPQQNAVIVSFNGSPTMPLRNGACTLSFRHRRMPGSRRPSPPAPPHEMQSYRPPDTLTAPLATMDRMPPPKSCRSGKCIV